MSLSIALSIQQQQDELNDELLPLPSPRRRRPSSMMSTSSSSSSLADMDILSSPLISSMLYGRESLASSGGIPIGGLSDPQALRRALRSRTTSTGENHRHSTFQPVFAPGASGSSSPRSGSSPSSSRRSSSTSLATLAEERPVSRAGSSGETLVAPPMPIPLPGSSYSAPSTLSPPAQAHTSMSRAQRRASHATYTPGTRSKLSSSYSAEGATGPAASTPELARHDPDAPPTSPVQMKGKAMSTATLIGSRQDSVTMEKTKGANGNGTMLQRLGRTLRTLSLKRRKDGKGSSRGSIPAAFVEVAAA